MNIGNLYASAAVDDNTNTRAATLASSSDKIVTARIPDRERLITTFATAEAKSEAIRNGQSSKMGFVNNVYQQSCIDNYGEIKDTRHLFTRIDDKTFLCCKQPAQDLEEAISYKQNGVGVLIFSNSFLGKIDLSHCYVIMHETADLAIVKLVIGKGYEGIYRKLPSEAFLSIADDLDDEKQGEGIVASFSGTYIAGEQKANKEKVRYLSPHKFKRCGDNLESSFTAKNSTDQKQSGLSAELVTFAGAILQNSKGAPLIVKKGDQFKIIGMLTGSGIVKESGASGAEGALAFKHSFLYLPTFKEWINDAKKRLEAESSKQPGSAASSSSSS